jgi:hypothetical protein
MPFTDRKIMFGLAELKAVCPTSDSSESMSKRVEKRRKFRIEWLLEIKSAESKFGKMKSAASQRVALVAKDALERLVFWRQAVGKRQFGMVNKSFHGKLRDKWFNGKYLQAA